jgi:DNA-binding transcriptional ArsR family regulator
MATGTRPDAGDGLAPAQLDLAAAIFDLLSTPLRLHLIWLLCHGDHDVGWLADQVGATVAAVSQQLSKLRLAGLVSAHRQGRYQIYSADDPHILMLVEQVFAHVAPDGLLAPGSDGVPDSDSQNRPVRRRPRFEASTPR